MEGMQMTPQRQPPNPNARPSNAAPPKPHGRVERTTTLDEFGLS